MISTSGLSAGMALKLIDREREAFETSVQKDVANAREIAAFRSRIGSIQSAEDLVKDYDVYAFVMKAFDLEDQIFGKAMMRKIFESDGSDKKSLVNKLTDSRFKEIFKEMGFADGGTTNPNTKNQAWVDKLVDRYVDRKIINNEKNTNEIVGMVLHVRAKAPELDSWYKVLADKDAQEFFYTALNLPTELKTADLDAQVATLKKKLDISTLLDPGVLDKLSTRYTAIAEAKAAQANLSSNPILQLFSNNSQGSIISLNLDGWSQLKGGRY